MRMTSTTHLQPTVRRGPAPRRSALYTHVVSARAGERGASLIVVMLIIVVVSILGISGTQIAMMGEHSARNDRDYQVAFQAAETALYDATNDMEVAANPRSALFAPGNKVDFPVGCGTTGTSKGLCAQETNGKPIWLQVDLADTSGPATAFGDFTGATLNAGNNGVRPSRSPRYIIEVIDDKFTVGTDQALPASSKVLYRTTAMGFGPRPDVQAVVQMLYSKE